jgi:hypothetical protein
MKRITLIAISLMIATTATASEWDSFHPSQALPTSQERLMYVAARKGPGARQGCTLFFAGQAKPEHMSWTGPPRGPYGYPSARPAEKVRYELRSGFETCQMGAYFDAKIADVRARPWAYQPARSPSYHRGGCARGGHRYFCW